MAGHGKATHGMAEHVTAWQQHIRPQEERATPTLTERPTIREKVTMEMSVPSRSIWMHQEAAKAE